MVTVKGDDFQSREYGLKPIAPAEEADTVKNNNVIKKMRNILFTLTTPFKLCPYKKKADNP